MLKLNKKYYFIAIGLLIGFFAFNLSLNTVQARDISALQVKTKDSSTVYFLSHKNHLKKAYINALAYLSYNNKWSDIKIVSAQALKSWSDAKLFRAIGSPHIYYIQGSNKALISSPAELIKFNLVGVPVLDVSRVDLVQYKTLSTSELGLGSKSNPNSNSSSNSSDHSSSVKLIVSSDQVAGANNNSLVPGTNDNLLGIFHFNSPRLATITSLTLHLSGIYNSQVINKFKIEDANGSEYPANINWRSSDHQILINFRSALSLDPGVEKTIKVLVDLNTCSNCNNETLRLKLNSASDFKASLPVSASWPLLGTQFTLVSASNILGQVTAQLVPLDVNDLVVTNGQRLIAKLNLSETSGNEDIIIKKLTFRNNGSANINDWQNFSLLQNGQIIARVASLNEDNQIVFNINYLRIIKKSTANLSLRADLLANYDSQHTYNLQLKSITALGATYNLALNPTINNINQSFPLN